MDNADFHPPPPHPPPFLNTDDLVRLSKQGFLSLTLPPQLQDKVRAFFTAADIFFHHSLEQKHRFYPGAADNTEVGFFHVPAEKQYVSFRHQTAHAQPLDIEQRLVSLWHAVAHLLFRVLFDIGSFLAIDNSAWFDLVRRSLVCPLDREGTTPSVLRVFRYEPDRGVADVHSDVGILTLCMGKGKGLQVWEPPGVSVAAGVMDSEVPRDCHPGTLLQPLEASTPASQRWRDADEFTLLVGHTLRVLSTNRMRSGRHRVVSNPDGRDSVVFALRPDVDTALDLRAFGGEGVVGTRALWEALNKGKVNVNAQKAARDEMRAKNRREREEKAARGKEAEAEGEGAAKGKGEGDGEREEYDEREEEGVAGEKT